MFEGIPCRCLIKSAWQKPGKAARKQRRQMRQHPIFRDVLRAYVQCKRPVCSVAVSATSVSFCTLNVVLDVPRSSSTGGGGHSSSRTIRRSPVQGVRGGRSPPSSRRGGCCWSHPHSPISLRVRCRELTLQMLPPGADEDGDEEIPEAELTTFLQGVLSTLRIHRSEIEALIKVSFSLSAKVLSWTHCTCLQTHYTFRLFGL